MDSDARTSLVIKVEPVVLGLSSGSSDQDEREETSSSEVKFHSLEQDEALNSSEQAYTSHAFAYHRYKNCVEEILEEVWKYPLASSCSQMNT
ncbi:hypothetical protein D5086_033291 [Populus alba]|uniref:Uncharacterized protein n=1 Tax=Populus alba TaxID=43335 RepID=A0ACC4AGJ4_POPAL